MVRPVTRVIELTMEDDLNLQKMALSTVEEAAPDDMPVRTKGPPG